MNKSLLLLTFVVMLFGCNDGPGTWVNQNISSGKRNYFHNLNTEALQYLKVDDMNGLSMMLSKELAEDNYTNRTADLISNELKAGDYNLMDEYYLIRDSTKADTIQVHSPGKGQNGYNIEYTGAVGAKYIALFAPKKGFSKSLISIIYYKYDYGWKIASLGVAPYTINGKTAPELFEAAKQQLSHNHLISALNNAQLAVQCLRPAEIWKYEQEDEINAFYNNLLSQANQKYHFPIILTQVAGQPKIISVINQTNDGGSYPKIYYISSIKVADTDAIKKENLAIRKIIGTVMPGIDEDNKYLLYSVTNKTPSISESVPSFDMVEKLR